MRDLAFNQGDRDWIYRSCISIVLSVFIRLLTSYVVIPGSLVFSFILFETYTNGLLSVLSAIDSVVSVRLSEEEASFLLELWSFSSLVVFIISWLLLPWQSPPRDASFAGREHV